MTHSHRSIVAVEDEFCMRHALRLARNAATRGEVPVGAIATVHGRVLAAASNQVERSRRATAHAEMLVLAGAARRLGSWRLDEVTLYVTLEPCPMCAGAILLSRIPRLVYGADDPRKGAFRSAYDVLGNPAGNHHPEIVRGVAAAESAALLRSFFQALRRETGGAVVFAQDSAITSRDAPAVSRSEYESAAVE